MRKRTLVLAAVPAIYASAGIIYTSDQRNVQSVFCFQPGGVLTFSPSPPFSAFTGTSTSSRSDEFGTFSGWGHQFSWLSTALMEGSGSAVASAAAPNLTNCDAFGSSKFLISFRVPVKSHIQIEGLLAGSGSNATLLSEFRSGPTPSFKTTIPGSFLHTAMILPARTYTITVSVACRADTNVPGPPHNSSSAAEFSLRLTVGPVCVGDLDSDSQVDDLDFLLFVGGYNTLDCADPVMAPGCPADLNNDGIVDDTDFTLFIPAYDTLVCP